MSSKVQGKLFEERVKKVTMVAGVILGVYLLGVIIFSTVFVPGTRLGSFDVSLKTAHAAQKTIDDSLASYRLSVSGDGLSFDITAGEAGLTVDSEVAVQDAKQELSGWKWPFLLIGGSHDQTDKLTGAIDSGAVANFVSRKVEDFNENADTPVQANIFYNEDSGGFEVVAEKEGTMVDEDAVISAVGTAMANLQPALQLGDDQMLHPAVYSDDERIPAAIQQANTMLDASVTLTLGGKDVVIVDKDDFKNLIVLDENAEAVIGKDEFSEWVYEIIPEINTVGSERDYTRPDGKECTVEGGDFGWGTDVTALREQVAKAAMEGKAQKLAIPCTQEGQVYTGGGEQDWGPRYIDVDIDEQHVRFYDENSQIIWESDCVSGAADGEHDTVQGVWTVNDKQSPSILTGYKYGEKLYETEVSYWMAFEGSSIGFHDAEWQPKFGGTLYEDGAGSHGCINLPVDAAGELYDIVQIGDVVVVHE